MRMAILGAALAVVISGCDAFERPPDGNKSPIEVGVETGSGTFSRNTGTGTAAEIIYAAVSALTASAITGYAAYKRGQKKGAEAASNGGKG